LLALIVKMKMLPASLLDLIQMAAHFRLVRKFV
jgi:hypothetical protein